MAVDRGERVREIDEEIARIKAKAEERKGKRASDRRILWAPSLARFLKRTSGPVGEWGIKHPNKLVLLACASPLATKFSPFLVVNAILWFVWFWLLSIYLCLALPVSSLNDCEEFDIELETSALKTEKEELLSQIIDEQT